MKDRSVKRKRFSGWMVLISCCVIYMCITGILNNSSSHYILPVTEELNIPTSVFMLGQVISSLFTMAAMLYVFKLFDKFNYRILMPVTFVLYCGVYFCYSFVTEVYQIYILAVLQGVLSFSTSFVVVSTAVKNWFVKKRGLILGIAMSFTGIGGVIFNPVVANLITAYGWRETYQIMAVVILALVLPFLLLFFYLRPEDKGQRPYGAEAESDQEQAALGKGLMRNEALRTKNFWLAAGTMFLGAFCCQGLLLNSAPLFITEGHSQVFAGYISSISMVSVIAGKFLLGECLDRFGTKRSALGVYALMAAGVFVLLLRGNAVFAVAGVIMGGLAVSLNTVLIPLFCTDLFGDKDYANIYSIINVFTMAASSCSSLVPGLIYDLTGSYDLMLWIWGITMVAAVAVMAVLINWRPVWKR